ALHDDVHGRPVAHAPLGAGDPADVDAGLALAVVEALAAAARVCAGAHREAQAQERCRGMSEAVPHRHWCLLRLVAAEAHWAPSLAAAVPTPRRPRAPGIRPTIKRLWRRARKPRVSARAR